MFELLPEGNREFQDQPASAGFELLPDSNAPPSVQTSHTSDQVAAGRVASANLGISEETALTSPVKAAEIQNQMRLDAMLSGDRVAIDLTSKNAFNAILLTQDLSQLQKMTTLLRGQQKQAFQDQSFIDRNLANVGSSALQGQRSINAEGAVFSDEQQRNLLDGQLDDKSSRILGGMLNALRPSVERVDAAKAGLSQQNVEAQGTLREARDVIRSLPVDVGLQDAKKQGVGAVLAAIAEEPSRGYRIVLEGLFTSLPSLAAGLVTGVVGGVLAGFQMEHAAGVSQGLANRGIDLASMTEEEIIKTFSDKKLREELSNEGLLKGGGIAAFDALGIVGASMMLAPAKILGKAFTPVGREAVNLLIQAPLGGLSEAGGEAAGSYLAFGNFDPVEVLIEGLSGAGMSVGDVAVFGGREALVGASRHLDTIILARQSERVIKSHETATQEGIAAVLDVIDKGQELALQKTDPKLLHDYLQESKKGGIESVFVTPEAVERHATSTQAPIADVLKALGVTEESFKASKFGGGYVEIGVEQLVVSPVAAELLRSSQEDAKVNYDGVTTNEAQAIREISATELAATIAALENPLPANSDDTVYRDVFQQLMDTGRVSEAEARGYARLWQSTFHSLAAKTGATATEIYNELRPEITRGVGSIDHRVTLLITQARARAARAQTLSTLPAKMAAVEANIATATEDTLPGFEAEKTALITTQARLQAEADASVVTPQLAALEDELAAQGFDIITEDNNATVAALAKPELPGTKTFFQAPQSTHASRVSTRLPSAKPENIVGDPNSNDNTVSLEVARKHPSFIKRLAAKIRAPFAPRKVRMVSGKMVDRIVGFPLVKPTSSQTDEQVIEQVVLAMTDNLLWLHDQVPADVRARSRMWYVGANAFSRMLSSRHGLTEAQTAGAIAALSPQQDWFQNASVGQRVIDTWAERQNHVWDEEMEATASSIYSKPVHQVIVDRVRGKMLRELNTDMERAVWIRSFDQAHNNQGYVELSPEGAIGPGVLTKGGARANVRWNSQAEISKAIGMLRDGSTENISNQLGGAHKVRSFYNNILNPHSDRGEVTIDTHAVAAALLRPLATTDAEVKDNFSGPTSAPTGLRGTYIVYSEAYRRAAEARGIEPREMQSITWEAVRSLFTRSFKSSADRSIVEDLWNNFYHAKKGDINGLRDAILTAAGGIQNPDWFSRPDNGGTSSPGDTTYESKLPRPDVRGREHPRPTTSGAGGEPAAGPVNNATGSGGVEQAQGAPLTLSSRDGERLDGLESRSPGPLPDAHVAARIYAERSGIRYTRQGEYVVVDPERASRIAKAFDDAVHSPDDPEVQAAYRELIDQTLAQYKVITEMGYTFTPMVEGDADPYAAPSEVLRDLHGNKHMYFYPTDFGYGPEGIPDPGSNMLLEHTGIHLGGMELRANDIFRIVHDFFGHSLEGSLFRSRGEENAWQAHRRMYTGAAVRALTTETRGQNSWLNFGPHGESNRTAKIEDTIFAEQKMALLPEWVSSEGVAEEHPGFTEYGQELVQTDFDVLAGDSPGLNADGRIELTNWGQTPGRETLDPAFYGGGIAGLEARRKRTDGALWHDRIYYGLSVGTQAGYVKERGLGNIRRTTTLDANELYNLDQDRGGFRAQAKALARSTPAFIETIIEDLIVKAGFTGYWTNTPIGPVAASFSELEVESEVDESGAVLEDFNNLTAEVLAKPGYAILTATVDGRADSENIFNNNVLFAQLRQSGDVIKVSGSYLGVDQGASFLFIGDLGVAKRLALLNKQESILTNEGLVYTDGRQNTPADHSQTLIGDAARKEDFYSELPDGTAFSVGLDFEADVGNPQVQTFEFKNFFGKSQVTHQDGSPMRVFHSTTNSFDTFTRGDIGYHAGTIVQSNMRQEITPGMVQAGETGHSPQVQAFEFKNASLGFRLSPGTNTMPLYMRIENPLRVNDLGEFDSARSWVESYDEYLDLMPTDVATAIHDHAQDWESSIQDLRSRLRASSMSTSNKTLAQEAAELSTLNQEWVQSMADFIKAHGYDGLVYKNEGESAGLEAEDSYVAFDSNQLKSAVGNSGAFDRNDPSVLNQSPPRGSAIDLFSDVEFGPPKFKSREKTIIMDLEQFLLLAEAGQADEQKTKRAAGIIAEGKKFSDIPFLSIDVSGDAATVVGHEGRHRARALLGAGYTTMPVRLATNNIRWSEQNDLASYDRLDVWPETLTGENGDVIEFPVPREQADSGAGELNQADPSQQSERRGSFQISVDRSQRIINLFGAKDLSTFGHESAHFFLEVLRDLDSSGRYNDADRAAIFKFLGISSWDQIETKHHEMWAEAFEKYMFEGNPPTEELRSTFRQFADWLRSVYKVAKDIGLTGVELNPEIRAVFDRLVAGHEMVDDEVRRGPYLPVFETAEAAGMTKAEFERYRAIAGRSVEGARERIMTRLMKDIKRRRTTERRNQLATLMDEMRDLIGREGSWQALEFLRNGKVIDPDSDNADAIKGNRLDAASVLELIGSDAVGLLPNITKKKGGSDPEVIAQQFGFRSGAEMLDAIMNLGTAGVEGKVAYPSLRQESKVRAERILDEADGTSLHPDRIRAEAATALHNIDRGELLALELRLLDDLAAGSRVQRGAERTVANDGPGTAQGSAAEVQSAQVRLDAAVASGDEIARADAERLLLSARAKEKAAKVQREADRVRVRKSGDSLRVRQQTFRRLAEEFVKTMAVGDFRRLGKFLQDERKASREASAAIARSDFQAASLAKQRELFNHFVFSEAVKAKDKLAVANRLFKRWQKVKVPGKVQVANEYVNPIHILLSAHNIEPARIDPAQARGLIPSVQAFVDGKNLGGDQIVLPDSVLNARHIDTISFIEAMNLKDAVRSLVKNGRANSEEARAEFLAEMEALAGHIEHNVGTRQDREELTRIRGGARDFIDHVALSHRKAEHLMIELDGFEDLGRMWRAVFEPVNTAANVESSMRADAAVAMKAIWTQMNHLTSKSLTKRENIVGLHLSREEMIVIGMNWGNEGNREALLNGSRKWQRHQLESVVSALTKEEWSFIQDSWALIDSYWPAIAALEERMTGVHPEKIEGESFTLSDGTVIQGGYYPIKFDPKLNVGAKKDATQEQAKQLMSGDYSRAATRHGFTNERKGSKESGKRVWLSFDAMFRHIDDVIHDISHREAVLQVWKTLNNRPVQEAMANRYGVQVGAYLNRWLQNVAAGTIEPQDVSSLVFRHLRVGMSLAEMGLSLRTMLVQPFGITNTMALIGLPATIRGIANFTGQVNGNVFAKVEYVDNKSPYMAERGQSFDRDIAASSRRLNPGDKVDRLRDMAFWGISKLDMMVSYSSWLGAYDKAASEGKNEADAVDLADQVVRTGQGSGLAKDLADIQSGGEGKRLLTAFYTFFAAYHNLVVDASKRTKKIANKDGVLYATPYAAMQFMYLAVLPALLSAAVLDGGPGDDEDWWAWASKLIVGYGLSGMVFLREAAAFATTDFGYGGPPSFRAIETALNFTTQVAQGDVDKALVRTGLMTAGYLGHLPTRQAWRSIEALWEYSDGDATAFEASVGFAGMRHFKDK